MELIDCCSRKRKELQSLISVIVLVIVIWLLAIFICCYYYYYFFFLSSLFAFFIQFTSWWLSWNIFCSMQGYHCTTTLFYRKISKKSFTPLSPFICSDRFFLPSLAYSFHFQFSKSDCTFCNQP